MFIAATQNAQTIPQQDLLVAGARLSSNFNTEPPAYIVQIPLKGQQGELIIRRLGPMAA
jgi:hypothetical protein